MVDLTEAHALADELISTAIRFYGSEANLNNEAFFLALVNVLCFSMVERFSSDDEIKDRFNKMLPICIAEQREFARTLPPRLTIVDSGRPN